MTATRHRTLLIGVIGLFALLAAACSVQETNAYPVDVFTEMHFAQSTRSQEPPRLLPPARSVAYEPAGGPDRPLVVEEFSPRPYVREVAAELYSVNCSVCHGVSGLGDGPAVVHLKSNRSFYATTQAQTSGAVMGDEGERRLPPNLIESPLYGNDIGLAAFIRTGGNSVMPTFEKFLTEEEIWDIVAYIQDSEAGLRTAQ